MGLDNRSYMDGGGYGGGGGPARHIAYGMPKPSKAVKVLLLVNIAVFVLQLIFDGKMQMSSLLGATPAGFWQPWRYLTFQFLHDTRNIMHIGFNMLGLYMLGTPIEQRWGTKRFVTFYLTCGAAAGVAYVLIGNIVGGISWVPLVGASGGVFGILLAAAVMFPNFRLIMILFPVPIRFACLIIFGGMAFIMIKAASTGGYTGQFWSHVAHFGGVLASAVWIWVLPGAQDASQRVSEKINRGAWERKMQKQAQLQGEIDAILQKIHDKGIGSLTAHEKKTLNQATRRQREEEKRINRTGYR